MYLNGYKDMKIDTNLENRAVWGNYGSLNITEISSIQYGIP